jgi:hypothetical protein
VLVPGAGVGLQVPGHISEKAGQERYPFLFTHLDVRNLNRTDPDEPDKFSREFGCVWKGLRTTTWLKGRQLC